MRADGLLDRADEPPAMPDESDETITLSEVAPLLARSAKG